MSCQKSNFLYVKIMPFLVPKPPSPKMALATENNNSLQSWCDVMSSHVNSMKMELKKRIGILCRMTFQLPRHIVTDLIQPVFTSKLLYCLALLASAPGCLTENTLPSPLGLFHRQAMKVALGIKKARNILLRPTRAHQTNFFFQLAL